MLWIYNIGIVMYGLLLKLAALFNEKAKLFVNGRKNIFENIAKKVNAKDRPIWFHFASLGEFEQGRPVLERLKSENHSQKIVVTFFSPSGYEIRKNYALADVFYLPLDTASNANQFIELINPKSAIFTKYEFWFHYFKELDKRQIPLYLISGIFRPNQSFFKWYGGFYRNILKYVTHFFVQNEESISLLKGIGINEVSLAGDTRFDRVYENAQQPKKLDLIESFCGTSNVFIAGSTWPEDEKLLILLTKKYLDWKFIIAPHEIGASHITEIEGLFPEANKFSVHSAQISSIPSQISNLTSRILIIDNIGMLSSLYQYAKVSYIGGGFGVGIHNTLEAAAFGLPVIFGPKYDKFQEAKDLIAIGAARSISTLDQLIAAFEDFRSNEKASADAKNYVKEKKGATEMIIETLNKN
ncbi:3-deoxy-D-manno-octulosonic acid transferase [Pedobacter frigiditerrae]|uniref:3-deoxy-D-manno-octulosonic acid transferase n=1 Tax=Pedobacter frigiditerrae TaxID=2530452 RepID=A0A4R0N3T5_9SPHI|nr:glycosyltransferase N-terminal domain-containing protein [Pedobacter frigiditerrae]TCC94531.1 3-deoxy-D-manno-octulosonic acid transferase [Pedobacter frigiditerrae]